MAKPWIVCSTCGEAKPETAFAHGNKGKRRLKCKECGGRFGYQLKYHYGVSKADYERMFDEQGGRCAVCRKPSADGTRLRVDHCHSTGYVRGLLCHKCNVGLGMLGDDPAVLLRALKYLVWSV